MLSCGLSSSTNVLGLALHQWSHKYVGNSERIAYAMKKKKKSTQKNFVVCAYALVGGSRTGCLLRKEDNASRPLLLGNSIYYFMSMV